MKDVIIQIPGQVETPFADHDTWSAASVDLKNDYRRRTINVLSGEIEQLIAANNQAQLDAAKPTRWNV